MSETDGDPLSNGDAVAIDVNTSDAARFEQGAQAMTPDEAGVPSLAEVIAQSQNVHEQVADTMGGEGDFPETIEGYPDTEKD